MPKRLSSTTTEADRESPCWLFVKDAGVLIKQLRYLPWVFIPLKTVHQDGELYLSFANIRENGLQVALFLLEIVLLLVAVPIFLLLPGIITTVAAVACCFLILGLTNPLQGPRIAYSKMNDEIIESANQHKHERWLFINGIATGHSGLQKNIDLLAKTFRRPVIGIHNQRSGCSTQSYEYFDM